MNKVVYIFLSLVVTFKSFPVSVFFWIQDKNGDYIILNKCTKKDADTGVNLDEVELKKIKRGVTDNDTLISWCRIFTINNINFIDTEKLEKDVFPYDYAGTVDFLTDVFFAYGVLIYVAGKDCKNIQINKCSDFLTYINSGDKSRYPYLYICFSGGSVIANKLIAENEKKISIANERKDGIIKEIGNMCNEFLKNIKVVSVNEKTSFNFDNLLDREIDSYFSNKRLNKRNLTGMSFVNKLLINEIEELKKKYVKICKNVIDKKKAEVEKKKKIKKEIGSKASATNTISTTNKFKDNANANISSTATKTNISKITNPKISSTITDSKINSHKFNIPVDINTNINNTVAAATNNKYKTTTSTGAKPTTSTVAGNINKTEVDNDLIKGSETSDGSTTTTTSKFGGCCSSCKNNTN